MNKQRIARQLAMYALLLIPTITRAAPQVRLSFDAQTDFMPAKLSDTKRETLAIGGRNSKGMPILALLRVQDGELELREITLPDDTVAIDVGPGQTDRQAYYVLCASGILAIEDFESTPKRVLETTSMFRGRSYAELTTNIDFATDINNDGSADFLVQDFDVVHASLGPNHTSSVDLALPSIRRGYDRAAAYRPARIASADGRALISVRGNSLLSFDFRKQNNSPVLNTTPLPLGLSDEFEIESFYNGYDNVDQSEIVLREPELLRDINGDSLPDLITLETRSTGVFDKESTYRIHNGRSSPSGVAFLAEPDSVLSSRGFQFGLRAEKVDSANTMLISPGVKIGIRTIVGALFSKSVTLQIAIYAPDDDGVVAAEPSTTVRTKISFDFSSGQAEFPTIEFGDIDGDGLNDLVLKRRSDQLVWRRNLGNNQFDSSNQELAIQAPADGSAVVASDLNGDGRAEIIVRYARADSESLNRLVRFTTGAVEP